jgi:hypothetical protein
MLYSSVEAFGTLQSLHLIPAGQTMSLQDLILFYRQLPIQPPSLYGALTSPFVLLWVYTWMNQKLQSVLWYIIRSVTPKPDNPDRISCLALEGTEDADAKIPGLRQQPWMLSDEMRFLSSKMKNWLSGLLGPLRRRDQTGQNGPSPESPVDPLAQAREDDRASTATPDPEDLFNMEDIEQLPDPDPESFDPEPQPLSRTNTLFTPLNQSPATTPPASPRVRASLIHRDSETVTMQLELLESQRETDEQLHNQSLEALDEEPANNSENASAGAGAPDVETMVSELARAIRERDEESSVQAHRHDRPQHRVTALSNFSSDAFASHAACLITTATLIPLETLFVRSLALSFLGPSRLARDVRPLFSWQTWKFHGTMLAILGLQALVSSVVWGLGTGVAVGLGRMKYRWGRL